MLTLEKYINEFKENLHKHTDQLVQNISEVSDFNYDKGVDLLDIQIFIQPFSLSIMLFSMDKDANEVFYEGQDPSIIAGSHELIGEVDYYDPSNGKLDAFYELAERDEEEFEKMEYETVVEWFVDCWYKAGGTRMKLPVYLGFHDAGKSLFLHENKWISDGDKWV